MVTTERLRLVPSTPELARAELSDRLEFGSRLGAEIPENWPPETLVDALPMFLNLMVENPSWEGWLGWYALAARGSELTLVGSAGFLGPVSGDGVVEVGYSVLPQFQRQGYATEMVEGLVGWARERGAESVVAQTTDDNTGSRGVLSKLGFTAVGPGQEPGHTLYQLSLGAGGNDS